MSFGELLRGIGSLAVTCALLVVAMRALAKAKGSVAGAVKLHGGVGLGGGKGVWLVEAMGKRFLVVITEHAVEVLAEENVGPTDQAQGRQGLPDLVAGLLRSWKG
ncbi:MAG: hypothetical protein ACPLPR_02885 [Bacillota bacterium]